MGRLPIIIQSCDARSALLTLALTVALWFFAPARRKLLVWLAALLLMVLIAFSLVFSAFAGTMDPSRAMGYYTAEIASGRYLFPLLVGWSAIVVTLLYRGTPTPTLYPKAQQADTTTRSPSGRPDSVDASL